MGFGAKTVQGFVDEINKKPDLDTLDCSGNASVKMKGTEAVQALADALRNHKGVKRLILADCEITDPSCEILSKLLMENHTIEEVNLEKNNITSAGAIFLAGGLTNNHGVRTLNLLQQKVKSFGEDCLQAYVDMYTSNITLTKITWFLNSRKSFMLNKLQTRNVEIRKRVDGGKDYKDYLPDHMKANPPDLTKSGDEIAKAVSSGAPAAGYTAPAPAPAAEKAPEPAPAAPEPAAPAEPEPAAPAEPEPAAPAEPEPAAASAEPEPAAAPEPEKPADEEAAPAEAAPAQEAPAEAAAEEAPPAAAEEPAAAEAPAEDAAAA